MGSGSKKREQVLKNKPENVNDKGVVEQVPINPLEELLACLGSPSWQVRKDSSEKLAAFGEKIVSHLIRSLNSVNEDQRFWALVTLCRIDTEKALKPVLKLTTVKDAGIRGHAAIALGYSRHMDSSQQLINLLNDPDWRVCNHAVNSLVMHGSSVIDNLIEALKSASYNAAFWITKALSRMGDDGIEVLIAFSRFKSKNIRMLVSEALCESENQKAVQTLLSLLKDEHWMVRQNAVDSLIRMGGKVIEPLIFFMRNEKENMIPFVEKVFSGLGEHRITPLVSLLQQEDREIRVLAADALG
ncbi:MAG: HEAT repeat domain-containing protein, partial [Candidatus Wallbacteria bacterium]|nr:HEAT repeat domain-containing protein [Candidatus Wallbacteria bacterium]